MINRSVGRCRSKDSARAFIVGKIPDFIEKVGSNDDLRQFAIEYFKDNPDSVKIMQVFEKSIGSDEFKKYLNAGVTKYKQKNYSEAEELLPTSLTVFRQSENLQAYAYPDGANTE